MVFIKQGIPVKTFPGIKDKFFIGLKIVLPVAPVESAAVR